MHELLKVNEAEFDEFIAAYPRPLETSVYRIAEPPLVTYNDWALGTWPDSIVATYSLADPPEGAHGHRIARLAVVPSPYQGSGA